MSSLFPAAGPVPTSLSSLPAHLPRLLGVPSKSLRLALLPYSLLPAAHLFPLGSASLLPVILTQLPWDSSGPLSCVVFLLLGTFLFSSSCLVFRSHLCVYPFHSHQPSWTFGLFDFHPLLRFFLHLGCGCPILGFLW